MTLTELTQTAPPITLFQTTVSTEGASTVVSLRGEADLCTLPAVVAVLARVIADHDGPVIVDLAEAEFVDLGTVRAFGRAARFLSHHGRTLTVRGASRMAVRLLAFLGLSDLAQQDHATAA